MNIEQRTISFLLDVIQDLVEEKKNRQRQEITMPPFEFPKADAVIFEKAGIWQEWHQFKYDSRDQGIYAIRFNDGKVWDLCSGWRHDI